MHLALGTLHNEILDQLERDAQAIAGRMMVAVRDEVDEYRAVRDPAFVEEVLAHAVDHVLAFVRCGRAGRHPAGDELEFVRARGARRARELMPLDALLETYLIGQRVVWEAIVAAAGETPAGMRTAQELTAFTFRYTHAINVAVAQAYLRESRAVASERERGRRDLLDHLLAGRPPGPEEERRAETLGLRPDGDHVVVVAVGDDEGLVVRALARAEPEDPFVIARHGEVVAIVPVYARRGPRELRHALARTGERLVHSRGVSLRAGVSSVCSGLGDVGRGHAEAARALRHAGAGAVVAIEEIPLFEYLAGSADETVQRLIPIGTASLVDADRRAGGALASTLRAYADCDLNVARTAERLGVHPNTVHYRLRRVQDLSGRDPRRFAELVELLTALRLLAAPAR
jgi:PucR C-terminal helix-turn-helix domain/GGDEF-like domain